MLDIDSMVRNKLHTYMGGFGEGKRGCGERKQKSVETCQNCENDKSWTVSAQTTLQVQ